MKYLSVLLLGILGCQACPQKAVYRETMDAYNQPIYKDWQDWAPKMVASPQFPNGQKDQLPTLTQKQYENGMKLIEDANKFRDADRAGRSQ
jgi:hypothetical protein